MEEIDIAQLLKNLWSNKLEIFLILLLFIIIGVIYTVQFVNPLYTSSTTLVLAGTNSSTTNRNTDTSITTTDMTLNSKLVSTYSEIVKSKKILRQVISNLDIDVDKETLEKNITVNAVKNTELIEITVTDENKYIAAQIANEIAEVFISTVKDIYNIENVHVIDRAEIEEEPSNINHKRDIILFAGIGLIVATLYVSLASVLDTTIKSAEEIETVYKLPVLASIPVCVEGSKKGGKR